MSESHQPATFRTTRWLVVFAAQGKSSARGGIDYDQLGVTLGMQPASARSAVHRLRKRFRELFRDEVSSTVADPAEVDDEMRAVIAALGAD
jgi:DNA polymerase II large subunit